MKKTSLYIEPEVDFALARTAATQGISKAELIRRALAAAVADRPRPKPLGRGLYAGSGDVAENTDEALERTGFGRR